MHELVCVVVFVCMCVFLYVSFSPFNSNIWPCRCVNMLHTSYDIGCRCRLHHRCTFRLNFTILSASNHSDIKTVQHFWWKDISSCLPHLIMCTVYAVIHAICMRVFSTIIMHVLTKDRHSQRDECLFYHFSCAQHTLCILFDVLQCVHSSNMNHHPFCVRGVLLSHSNVVFFVFFYSYFVLAWSSNLFLLIWLFWWCLRLVNG